MHKDDSYTDLPTPSLESLSRRDDVAEITRRTKAFAERCGGVNKLPEEFVVAY